MMDDHIEIKQEDDFADLFENVYSFTIKQEPIDANEELSEVIFPVQDLK